jgi:hypothetical protein
MKIEILLEIETIFTEDELMEFIPTAFRTECMLRCNSNQGVKIVSARVVTNG